MICSPGLAKSTMVSISGCLFIGQSTVAVLQRGISSYIFELVWTELSFTSSKGDPVAQLRLAVKKDGTEYSE